MHVTVHRMQDSRPGSHNACWFLLGSTHDDRLHKAQLLSLDTCEFPFQVCVTVTRPEPSDTATPSRLVAALLPQRVVGADVIQVTELEPYAKGLVKAEATLPGPAQPHSATAAEPVHADKAAVAELPHGKRATSAPIDGCCPAVRCSYGAAHAADAAPRVVPGAGAACCPQAPAQAHGAVQTELCIKGSTDHPAKKTGAYIADGTSVQPGSARHAHAAACLEAAGLSHSPSSPDGSSLEKKVLHPEIRELCRQWLSHEACKHQVMLCSLCLKCCMHAFHQVTFGS